MKFRFAIGMLGVAGTSGCGRFAFDLHDDALVDALPVTCDRALGFEAPVPIAELNTTFQDGTFRLAADELSGYFWSGRSGGVGADDLYLATRAAITDPFTVTLAPVVNAVSNDLDPTTSDDQLALVFRGYRGGNADLWLATRATVADDFGVPTQIVSLASASSESEPFWSSADQRLYFISSRAGPAHVYDSIITGTSFAAPNPVVELQSDGVEGDPVVSRDGLEVYWRSTRSGGMGGYDVWVAHRDAVANPFGIAKPVTGLNSTSDDGPSWLSLDGCRLYLSSMRAGSNDVYVARRSTM